MLLLGAAGENLVLCDWMVGDRIDRTLSRISRYIPQNQRDNSHVLELAERQLDEYFSGERREFDLPIKAYGTEFQKEVWAALRTIGFGELKSYQEIAEAIGRPKATRAVANAIGANPLSIVIPCHRVVRTGGTTGGYAGGVRAKLMLLDKETPTGLL